MTDITMTESFRISTVLNKAFGIFGRRLVPIIVLTAIAHIPNYFAGFLIGQPRPGSAADLARALAVLGVTVLIQIMVTTLASAVVIYGVVQEMRGRRFSAVESFSAVLPRLLPVLGVALSTGIPTALGILCLFVPGAILTCMWFVSVPVCVVEQTGVFRSMGRSRALTKGYRWQIFGAFVLIIGAVLVAGMVIGGAIGASMAFGGASPAMFAFVLKTTQLAVATLMGGFIAVFGGVCYSELRVAKEGVDIHKIASVFD